MTAYTGTVLVGKKWAEGEHQQAVGKYTYATTVVSGDTITWDFLPDFGAGNVTITDVVVHGDELDTATNPGGTFTLGDGTDADGYIAGGSVAGSLGEFDRTWHADGALTGTAVDSTNVVMTIGGTITTAATSGTVWCKVFYYCGDVTGS